MGLFDSGLDKLEQGAGDLLDDGAKAVSGGLNAVGAHGAAQTVASEGNRLASDLGANVGDLELGETGDPRQLVQGDASAIQSAAAKLARFALAFGETSDGLGRIETGHWTGAAADAFRERFSPEPRRWQTAAEAMGQVSMALESYAEAVEAAQNQARQAADLWQQGQGASGKGGNSGEADNEQQQEAQRVLAAARQIRNEAALSAASVANRAKDLAPAEPSFLDQLEDDASDTMTAAGLAADSVATGVVQGVAGIIRTAQALNPLDPWNLAHPRRVPGRAVGDSGGAGRGNPEPDPADQGDAGVGLEHRNVPPNSSCLRQVYNRAPRGARSPGTSPRVREKPCRRPGRCARWAVACRSRYRTDGQH